MTAAASERRAGFLDRPSPPLRAVTLLVFVGLVTGLIEGGWLALQQQGLHRLTFASSDALWMAPIAYVVLFGVAAVPVALAAWLAPKWATTRFVLGLGLTALVFSLLSLWFGLRLSQISVGLLSIGAGVQLSRVLTPHAERHPRRLLLVTVGLCLTLGLVAVSVVTRDRWLRSGRSPEGAAQPVGPNVLVIILDTVRAASLSLYGYDRPTSPRLAALARDGVTFDSAYSTAPWTLPAHGSMFTGLYHQDITADWLTPLDEAPRTLAEAFAASGYATAGFVGNLTYTSRESGLARGFGTYRDYKRSPDQLFNASTLYGITRDWLLRTRRARRANDRKDGPRVTAEFLEWLDREAPPSFFVFLNYFDAHLPRAYVQSGSVWDSGRRQVDAYDAAIARTDGYLGDLLDSLQARGALANTLVIVTSDHGTLVGEHGLSGHGNALYHPLLHVPLVVRGPGVPAGGRVTTAVSLRDLAETVRDAAGLTGQPPFPGASLAPTWGARPMSSPSPLLAQVSKGINTPLDEPVTLGTMTSIISDGDQYILDGRGKEELFNLPTDPDEARNLAGEPARQSTLDALRDRMRALKRPGWGGAPDVPSPGTPGVSGP